MSPPNFPIDKAYLVGGWLASALWGGYTIIFLLWMTSVLNKRENIRRHYVPMAAVCLMYMLATAHIALVLARLIQGFIVHIHDEGGAISYFADIGQPLNRSKDMIYISMIVLGDLILVWRCFMVWNRNYYAISLPAIMVVGTAVSGYGSVGRYFTPNPYEAVAVRWAGAMLSISMATNILVTGLTAGRIWRLSHQLGASNFQSSQVKYHSVILIIIESGIFMAISKTIEFILFQISPDDGLNGLNAFYIPLECMPQIMGIFPALIMLAVNKGFTTNTTSHYAERPYVIGSGNDPGKPPTIAFAQHDSTTRISSTHSGTYHQDSFQLKNVGV